MTQLAAPAARRQQRTPAFAPFPCRPLAQPLAAVAAEAGEGLRPLAPLFLPW